MENKSPYVLINSSWKSTIWLKRTKIWPVLHLVPQNVKTYFSNIYDRVATEALKFCFDNLWHEIPCINYKNNICSKDLFHFIDYRWVLRTCNEHDAKGLPRHPEPYNHPISFHHPIRKWEARRHPVSKLFNLDISEELFKIAITNTGE